MHDADDFQTASRSSSEPRPVPHPNVVVHVIHKTAPISPSEQRRDRGRCPSLKTGQHTNPSSDADLRPMALHRASILQRQQLETLREVTLEHIKSELNLELLEQLKEALCGPVMRVSS